MISDPADVMTDANHPPSQAPNRLQSSPIRRPIMWSQTGACKAPSKPRQDRAQHRASNEAAKSSRHRPCRAQGGPGTEGGQERPSSMLGPSGPATGPSSHHKSPSGKITQKLYQFYTFLLDLRTFVLYAFHARSQRKQERPQAWSLRPALHRAAAARPPAHPSPGGPR